MTTPAFRVLVGTCSWTDKTLTEETDWYPRRTMTAEERLKFYASRFPIVEVDSTYYFPPSPRLVHRTWVERTPKQFTMNVKAYSLLTGHPTQPKSLWRDLRDELPDDVAAKRNLYAHHLEPDALDEVWARFVDALAPLVKARKLGAVLMQYPQWFVPKRDNRDELFRMRERMGDLPVCVELRAPTWFHVLRDARPDPRPPARPPALFGDRRRAPKALEVAQRCSRGHRRRPRGRALPRPRRLRHLGRAHGQRGRALQLPVLEAAAPAVGQEARVTHRPSTRGPR